MSLLILGRNGERKVVTNLGDEIEIRIVRIEPDRVLLDVTTRKNGAPYITGPLPQLLNQTD